MITKGQRLKDDQRENLLLIPSCHQARGTSDYFRPKRRNDIEKRMKVEKPFITQKNVKRVNLKGQPTIMFYYQHQTLTPRAVLRTPIDRESTQIRPAMIPDDN